MFYIEVLMKKTGVAWSGLVFSTQQAPQVPLSVADHLSRMLRQVPSTREQREEEEEDDGRTVSEIPVELF